MEISKKMIHLLEKGDYCVNFDETELRLGLPGAGEGETMKVSGKRGFSETVDLKLNLKTTANVSENLTKEKNFLVSINESERPSAPKAQVVGWPPVRSFRKNILSVHSPKSNSEEMEKLSNGAIFIKVSMDGAPYLRKVDLKMYKSYQEFSKALEKMFSSFTFGNSGEQGANGKDFLNESKLLDLLTGSEYVATYEDKDGDWMLVGDVPWEMFVDSCNRLRIMKGSEAIGLAPRAMEKSKKRVEES